MQFKRLLAAMLCVVMALLVVGCGSTTSPSPSASPSQSSSATPAPSNSATPAPSQAATPAPTDKAVKVALLLPGVLGDKSFFDSAARGIEEINAKYAGKVDTKVNQLGNDPTKWQPALYEASQQDYDLIMCVSWSMAEALAEIAPQFPDKKYIICDTGMPFEDGNLSNVIAITYKANEGSFLAGIVAASLSESGKIGFLGGQDTPLINDFLVGYIEGAQAIKPDVKVSVSYVGDYVDSAKGKELALAQYRDGVDVGFNVAGGAGLGQIDAAVELNKLAIGVDSDQAMLFDTSDPAKAAVIPTSMIKDVGASLAQVYDMYVDGSAPWGEMINLGLKEGTVGVVDNKYYQDLVSSDIQNLVKEYEGKIKKGEITVTNAYSLNPEQLKAILDAAR